VGVGVGVGVGVITGPPDCAALRASMSAPFPVQSER
jgi:hypothetical protein